MIAIVVQEVILDALEGVILQKKLYLAIIDKRKAQMMLMMIFQVIPIIQVTRYITGFQY